LIGLLPPDPEAKADRATIDPPTRSADEIYDLVRTDPSAQYDVRDLLAAIVDGGRFDEYRAPYGRTLCCGFGRLGGYGISVCVSSPKGADRSSSAV
jgi:3-methylcrotonyl-CoA carboxylase beta subunit